MNQLSFNTPVALKEEAVMYMPLGAHTVNGLIDDETAATLQLEVTTDTADQLNAWLKELLDQVEAGQGSAPFTDFDHKREKASMWPTSFVLGDDGIYLAGTWSTSGLESVKGLDYRYFSPELLVEISPEGKVQLIGLSRCLGGLVNEPAFTSNKTVTARATEGSADAPPAAEHEDAIQPEPDQHTITTAEAAPEKEVEGKCDEDKDKIILTLQEQVDQLKITAEAQAATIASLIEAAKFYLEQNFDGITQDSLTAKRLTARRSKVEAAPIVLLNKGTTAGQSGSLKQKLEKLTDPAEVQTFIARHWAELNSQQ